MLCRLGSPTPLKPGRSQWTPDARGSNVSPALNSLDRPQPTSPAPSSLPPGAGAEAKTSGFNTKNWAVGRCLGQGHTQLVDEGSANISAHRGPFFVLLGAENVQVEQFSDLHLI